MLKLFSRNASLLRRWQDALVQSNPVSINEPRFADYSENDLVLVHLQSLSTEQRSEMISNAGNTRVLVLTDTPDLDEGRQLILSGVRAYANSYIHQTLMPDMLSEVENGNIWAVPELIQSVLSGLLRNKITDTKRYNLSELSDRELEVFNQLILGLSNREISEALSITERTVKAHVGNILRKTGTQDRVHLILSVSQ